MRWYTGSGSYTPDSMPADPVDFEQETLLILTIYGGGAQEPVVAKFNSVCVLEERVEVDYDLSCGGGFEFVINQGYAAVAIPRTELPISPAPCGENLWELDPVPLVTPVGTWNIAQPLYTPTPCPDYRQLEFFAINREFTFNDSQPGCDYTSWGFSAGGMCPISEIITSLSEFQNMFDGDPTYRARDYVNGEIISETIDFDSYDLYVYYSGPTSSICPRSMVDAEVQCETTYLTVETSEICLYAYGIGSYGFWLIEKTGFPYLFQSQWPFDLLQ